MRGSSETKKTECSPQRFLKGNHFDRERGNYAEKLTYGSGFSLAVPLPAASPHIARTHSKNIKTLTPFGIAAFDWQNTSTDELFRL